MVIGSACLLISNLDTQVVLIVVTLECRVNFNILRRSPITFHRVSLWWCLIFAPHPTTYHSKCRGPIKKTSHFRPIYLTLSPRYPKWMWALFKDKNKNKSCSLANPWWNIHKNQFENRTSPNLSMLIGCACLSIP